MPSQRRRKAETIHGAALHRKLERVRALLDQGIDPNALAGERWTPLMHAARGGNARITQLLLDRGADVQAVNDYGRTALHEAITVDHPAAVRALLRGGADVNAVARIGGTPLAEAIDNADLEVVLMLVDAGADIATTANGGTTVLMWAAGRGHVELIRALHARGASLEAQAGGGRTALAVAASANQVAAVRALIDAGADVNAGTPPLTWALHASTDVITVLLDAGADPNTRNADGHSALVGAVAAGNDAVVDLLLARAGRLEAHVPGGGPVWRAALHDRAGMLPRLLDAPGADVDDTSTHDATTALMMEPPAPARSASWPGSSPPARPSMNAPRPDRPR